MLLNLCKNIWFYERGGMVDALDLKSTDTYKKTYTYQALTPYSPLCVALLVATLIFKNKLLLLLNNI